MPQYKYQVAKGIKWLTKFNYTDPLSGTTKTVYKRGFDSKRSAKQYEEDFLASLLNASQPPQEVIAKTFGDVFQEYLMSHKREDMKDSSLGTKFNIFSRHIFPYFETVAIDQITADDIANWQMTIKDILKPNGKALSDSYLRTIQSQFNSIINYAHAKGYLQINPLADIKNMGIKDTRVVFWSPEEYEQFAYHAMNYPEYYYAYEILYWCGLRQGEMFALTLDDIDFNDQVIHVTKTYHRINCQDVITTPKTPSSVRTVSMPAFLCDELKEYIAMLYEPQGSQRIFAELTKSNLTKNFHSIIEKAGLKQITLHGLRHSHVSLLISKKYDIFEVSKRIGHKSVKTTQDIYGHLFDSVQKSIAHDLDQLRRR